MHLRFLIGGTGNQLFQIATAPDNSIFSDIFLSKYLCRLLKLQVHEQLKLTDGNKIFGFLLLPILLIDAILARLVRFTLFVHFDLNSLSCMPLFNLISIGYFQSNSGMFNRTDYFDCFIGDLDEFTAVHVRGGDFLLPINKNEFGALTIKYYCDALENNTLSVRIFTDDYDYAKDLFKNVDQQVDIIDGSLEQMIRQCLNAKIFIASNSTLSFWISIARQSHGREVIVPKPFQLNSVLEVPGSKGTLNVEVEY